jgi:hypothetical protein
MPVDSSPADLEQAEASRRRRTRMILIGGGVGAVVVVAIVLAVVLLSAGPTVSMPESIGGQSQVHSPTIQLLARGFQSSFAGGHSVVGFYGTLDHPLFMVIALDKASPGEDPIKEGGSAFGQGSVTGQIDLAGETTRTVNGVTYGCAPYSRTGNSGTTLNSDVCSWNDGGTTGVVMSFDPSIDASHIVATAHDAVVS